MDPCALLSRASYVIPVMRDCMSLAKIALYLLYIYSALTHTVFYVLKFCILSYSRHFRELR